MTHDLAGLDLASLNPGQARLLGVVNAGRAAESHPLLAGDLGYGACGREVAVYRI